jgi:hypothetical protein
VTEATQELLGTIGIWLLVAGVLAIVVEMVLLAVWGSAVARRMRTLVLYMESERVVMRSDVERLTRAIDETKMLWRPYGRALRWVRHPLVVAVLGSYRRRRSRG